MTPESKRKLEREKKKFTKLCSSVGIDLCFNEVDSSREGVWCTIKTRGEYYGDSRTWEARVFLDAYGGVMSDDDSPYMVSNTFSTTHYTPKDLYTWLPWGMDWRQACKQFNLRNHMSPKKKNVIPAPTILDLNKAKEALYKLGDTEGIHITFGKWDAKRLGIWCLLSASSGCTGDISYRVVITFLDYYGNLFDEEKNQIKNIYVSCTCSKHYHNKLRTWVETHGKLSCTKQLFPCDRRFMV